MKTREEIQKNIWDLKVKIHSEKQKYFLLVNKENISSQVFTEVTDEIASLESILIYWGDKLNLLVKDQYDADIFIKKIIEKKILKSSELNSHDIHEYYEFDFEKIRTLEDVIIILKQITLPDVHKSYKNIDSIQHLLKEIKEKKQ